MHFILERASILQAKEKNETSTVIIKRKEEGPLEIGVSRGPETNNPASQTADPQLSFWLAFTERSRHKDDMPLLPYCL
ncbi:MAG: hypothetical protein ACLGSH_06420 [Acidobacteriota bacterium]